ncbi:MAG: ABC transporter permease [Cetobacterium sp.]
MRYEIKVAYNFLTKSKWQTLFLLAAIGTGVAVQLFISSLIVSLQDNLIDTILGKIAHVTIEDGDVRKDIKKNGEIYTYGNFSNERNKISNYENLILELKKDNNVKNVVPTLEENALYEKGGKSISLKIRGVDLESGNIIFKVKEAVYSGNNKVESNKILIGKRMAEDFFLSPNDILNITLSNGNKEKFIVNGIFDLEDAQSNNGLIYMDMLKAQRIFDKRGYINIINIQLKDIFLGNYFSDKFENRYPYLKATSWMKDGKQLLNALRSQTMSSLVIQIVILLSTTLSIASILYITVVQKTKEIGILKAIGASDFSIGFIVLLQGATVGFLGALFGCVLGIILIQIFQIGAKPSFIIVVKLPLILRILISSTLSGVIAAYIPGRKSMKLNPVEVIKGE